MPLIKPRNKEKRKRLVHIMSGVVILIHSYGHYENGHESYVYFALAGIIFLSIAVFHPVIEKKAPWIDGVFFVIEGILSMIVAADYFHMGKKALPYVYLLLGCFQIVMAFVRSRKGMKQHKLNHETDDHKVAP